MVSRVAKNPITLPDNVSLAINEQHLSLRGSKGELQVTVHPIVEVIYANNIVHFKPRDSSLKADALSGTVRALVNNIVTGVNQGYEKKLLLVGVGYRAQAQGNTLNLTLGFSHPVVYDVPLGIVIETPTQTEIVIRGIDKRLVGQVAANIRAYRPPEPYKGKGVRYAGEKITLKETKKK